MWYITLIIPKTKVKMEINLTGDFFCEVGGFCDKSHFFPFVYVYPELEFHAVQKGFFIIYQTFIFESYN